MTERRELFSEYFIYLTLGVWLAAEVLHNSNLKRILLWERNTINSTMTIVTFCLLVVQIVILQHYSNYEIILLSICSLLIAVATLNSGYNIMMSTWLFVVASKYIDMHKAIRITYIILLVTIAVVFFLYFGGSIEESVIYRGNIIRHSWGFSHPNLLGVRIFQLILAHCYLRRNRIGIVDYLIIAGGANFVDKVPNCKTAFYGLTIFLVMLALYKLMDLFVGGQVLLAKLLIIVAVISNVLSVFLSYINVRAYPVLAAFDKMMSNRFSLCHRAIRYYGITTFGQEVNLYMSKMGMVMRSFYIDTAYVAILIRYGIVVYLLFSCLYIWTMIYCLKHDHHFIVIILSMYAIYGIMENTFFSMTQYIFLLTLAFPLYSIDEKKSSANEISDMSVKMRYKITW